MSLGGTFWSLLQATAERVLQVIRPCLAILLMTWTSDHSESRLAMNDIVLDLVLPFLQSAPYGIVWAGYLADSPPKPFQTPLAECLEKAQSALRSA